MLLTTCRSPRRSSSLFGNLLTTCGLLVIASGAVVSADDEPATNQSSSKSIESFLMQRLVDRPNDAAAHRMLGRLRLDQNRLSQAESLLRRATELDPESAAAWFDAGRVAMRLDDTEDAAESFRRVISLAPDSDYAQDARQILDESGLATVVLAGYDITGFDGPGVAEALRDNERREEWTDAAPLNFWLESGVLYNSNVALAPSSRELRPDEPESFQGFLSPGIEWTVFDAGDWQAGTRYTGNFTLNEGSFRQFNLQSHTPGLFLQTVCETDSVIFMPRVVYEFTRDEFDQEEFSTRHSVLSVVDAWWSPASLSRAFVSVNQTDFIDDGSVPSIQSQDGWTTTLGLSHEVFPGDWFLTSLQAGVSGTLADIDGSDFRYQGVSLFSTLTAPLPCDAELSVTASWGYRDYYDFEGAPSRDESVWQIGGEAGRWITDHFRIAIVAGYDRFESDNVLFAADRVQAGLLTTLIW